MSNILASTSVIYFTLDQMELCQTSWPVCPGYIGLQIRWGYVKHFGQYVRDIFHLGSDGAMSTILASMSGIYWTLDHMGLCQTSWSVCLGYIGLEMKWSYVKHLGQYVCDIFHLRSDGAMSTILASMSGIYWT